MECGIREWKGTGGEGKMSNEANELPVETDGSRASTKMNDGQTDTIVFTHFLRASTPPHPPPQPLH